MCVLICNYIASTIQSSYQATYEHLRYFVARAASAPSIVTVGIEKYKQERYSHRILNQLRVERCAPSIVFYNESHRTYSNHESSGLSKVIPVMAPTDVFATAELFHAVVPIHIHF
jgi:hypothetical protein